MIYVQTGGYMGVSFTIPIDVALSVSEQLRTDGKVTRGRIGVQVQQLTEELAKSFGVASAQGVLVAVVEKNGPAQTAGLRPGDVVIAVSDVSLKIREQFQQLIAATAPKGTVALLVRRDDAVLYAPVRKTD